MHSYDQHCILVPWVSPVPLGIQQKPHRINKHTGNKAKCYLEENERHTSNISHLVTLVNDFQQIYSVFF